MSEELTGYEARIVEYLTGYKVRTYPNPMRSDGVFIGEDRPMRIEHSFLSGPREAVSRDAHMWPAQVSYESAERILRALGEAQR